ncbi:MAG: hypothetical protein GXO26_05940 [Crenarchaeota archaeon]|nr:hypothetical protein [Thermoproteota archaeon]
MVSCVEACERIRSILEQAVSRGYITMEEINNIISIIRKLETDAKVTFDIDTLRDYCNKGCPDVESLLPNCVRELEDYVTGLTTSTSLEELREVYENISQLCEDIKSSRVRVVSRSSCYKLVRTYDELIEDLRNELIKTFGDSADKIFQRVYDKYVGKIRELKERLRFNR